MAGIIRIDHDIDWFVSNRTWDKLFRQVVRRLPLESEPGRLVFESLNSMTFYIDIRDLTADNIGLLREAVLLSCEALTTESQDDPGEAFFLGRVDDLIGTLSERIRKLQSRAG